MAREQAGTSKKAKKSFHVWRIKVINI
jgi:hypothetical protein